MARPASIWGCKRLHLCALGYVASDSIFEGSLNCLVALPMTGIKKIFAVKWTNLCGRDVAGHRIWYHGALQCWDLPFTTRAVGRGRNSAAENVLWHKTFSTKNREQSKCTMNGRFHELLSKPDWKVSLRDCRQCSKKSKTKKNDSCPLPEFHPPSLTYPDTFMICKRGPPTPESPVPNAATKLDR